MPEAKILLGFLPASTGLPLTESKLTKGTIRILCDRSNCCVSEVVWEMRSRRPFTMRPWLLITRVVFEIPYTTFSDVWRINAPWKIEDRTSTNLWVEYTLEIGSRNIFTKALCFTWFCSSRSAMDASSPGEETDTPSPSLATGAPSPVGMELGFRLGDITVDMPIFFRETGSATRHRGRRG